jgi:hypothetical protein
MRVASMLGHNLSEPVTLEGLLNSSGIAISNFIPVTQTEDSVVLQWSSDKMNGMYEQAAENGDFSSQVNTYLDRYRQDCGKALDIQISRPEIIKAGTIAVADVKCAMPSNSYSGAFLFLRDGNGFSAILHTAYLQDQPAAQGVRDAIVAALKRSQGFVASQVMSRSASKASLKLNVPASTETIPAITVYDPEPVVVQ